MTSPEPTAFEATVVIVGYNGAEFLGPCLESLLAMDMTPSRYEAIYIDNASSDKSVEVVERFHASFPNLRIVRNKYNLGFPAAANQGAGLSRAPILVLLNQDTVVERSWLRELLWPFEDHPEIAAVGSRVINGDGPRLYSAALEVLYGGICIVHEGDRRTDAVSGCAMAVRVDVLRRVGGFAADLFMYGEDLDLGHRLRAAGHQIAYAPASVAHHQAIRASRASTRTYMFYSARNRVLVCVRNYRRKRSYLVADIFALFPLTAFAELVRSRRRKDAIGWLLEARVESLRGALALIRTRRRPLETSAP